MGEGKGRSEELGPGVGYVGVGREVDDVILLATVAIIIWILTMTTVYLGDEFTGRG